MRKFLAICGVSGVGKTSIIKELKKIDKDIHYIKPDTNRNLRDNETDKNYVCKEVLQENINRNEYVFVNQIYNNYYCTPKKDIEEAFRKGQIPTLDFPIQKYKKLIDYMGEENVYIVYISPPSMIELKRRLSIDNRDPDNKRFNEAEKELRIIKTCKFDKIIDLKLISNKNPHELAKFILDNYYQNLSFEKHRF